MDPEKVQSRASKCKKKGSERGKESVSNLLQTTIKLRCSSVSKGAIRNVAPSGEDGVMDSVHCLELVSDLVNVPSSLATLNVLKWIKTKETGSTVREKRCYSSGGGPWSGGH